MIFPGTEPVRALAWIKPVTMQLRLQEGLPENSLLYNN